MLRTTRNRPDRPLRRLAAALILAAVPGAAWAWDGEASRPLALRVMVAVPSSPMRDRAMSAGGLEYELAPRHPKGTLSVSAHWLHMRPESGVKSDAVPVILSYRRWTPWRGTPESGRRLFGGVGAGAAYVTRDVPGLVSRGATPAWTAFAGVEFRHGLQLDARVLAGPRLDSNLIGLAAGYRF